MAERSPANQDGEREKGEAALGVTNQQIEQAL
jgi:hypothetical protein